MADAAPKEDDTGAELPIVDPHHHLWDRRAGAAGDRPPVRHGFENVMRLAPRYLIDELLADMTRGHNVVATVFVQCGAMYRADGPAHLKPVGETEFVNGVGGDERQRPLWRRPRLRRHRRPRRSDQARRRSPRRWRRTCAAGSGRFRGIRHSASYDADPNVLGPLARQTPGLYPSDAFREGFARFAKLGLSFDAWLLEPQLGEFLDLVRAFPETTVHPRPRRHAARHRRPTPASARSGSAAGAARSAPSAPARTCR